MAEDALAFYLYDEESAGNKIPAASDSKKIKVEGNGFVNYIACDTIEYAKMHNNKAIKKTLTIPEWLNEAAIKAGINFSQVLQEALMEKVK